MNVVLKSPCGDYYLYSVIKTPRTEAGYEVRGLRLRPDGAVAQVTLKTVFMSKEVAAARVRTLAKFKILKKKCREVPIEELPAGAKKLLASDLDTVIDQDEFVEMVASAANERVVVFKDVNGLEAVFEVDTEYVAHVDPDDPDILIVEDSDGKPRNCFKDRFSSVVNSGRAKEVERRKDIGKAVGKKFLDFVRSGGKLPPSGNVWL
jgi:hypothetical protein